MDSTRFGIFSLALGVIFLGSSLLQAETIVIVDDSWADAGRDDGADPLDTNWWTTTNSSSIEVGQDFLGLVSGSSGRGIRATFPDVTIGRNESIKATYTFTTPDTVGDNRSTALRAALFDKLGRAGLEADLSASSSSPQPLYDGIPGYYSDFDLNTGEENTFIRERNPLDTQGRLMATTSAYFSLGGGGDSYTITPNTEYVGTLEVKRSGPNDPVDSLDITASLSQGGNLLSTNTESNAFTFVTTFGMLGFHANSRTFGDVNTPDTPDNGIDFSNVLIEVNRVPEPSSIALLATVMAGLAYRGRRS